MNTIAKNKLTSSSTRKASVTLDKPYEDHHLFMMWAESFAISSGTSSKMEASHEFVIAPSPSMWRHFACPCNIDKAIEQKILVHFSNHARQRSNLFFKPRDGITNSAAFLRVRQASHADLIYHFFQSHAELPKSLAVTDVIVSEFFLLSCNSSLANAQGLDFFFFQRINSSAQLCALTSQLLLVHRQ
jgi:hypothetical protein